MKPIIAFHKDADGNVLDTKATEYSFELDNWMRALDVRPGDSITFAEKMVRDKERADPASVEPLAIVEGGKKPAKVTA